jgi:hypothetical protein
MNHRSFLLAIALLFVGFANLSAQGPTGQISGSVTDPNGAVVVGASVKATNLDTNFTRQVITGAEGNFSFQLLPVGRYSVEVSSSGFQSYRAQTVVNVTQTTTVDAVLSISGAVTEVEVEAPIIQVETSQQGRVIGGETLRQLPLPTRNFQQILTLSAGAQSGVTNTTELGRGDALISVNGQRTTSNSVRINGVDANSIGTNSTPNIAVPATDSLQEFVVQTSLYDASSGRNSGGNVEAVTRGGSNDLRGSLYYFLRDTSMNANDPFVKARGLARPTLDRQQWGMTLGGPVVKDKVFFFTSYQGTRETNGASLTNSLTFPVVPAGLTDSNRTAAGLGAAFGLPDFLISPRAVAILNAKLGNGAFAIPSSGATGFSSITGIPIVQSGESRFRETQFNFNGDFNLSDKHSISAKFFIADNPTFQSNYNFAGLGNGQNQLSGFGGDLTIKQKLYSVTDTYIFSPNVVNQARFGYSRLRVTSVPEEPFSSSSLGMTNPLGSLFAGAPTLSFSGTDSLFVFGSSTLADQSSRINGYSFSDTLSITKGNHRIRIGGEYKFSQVKFYFNAFSRGQIIYSDTFTSGVLTSTAFQNFLLGVGTSLIGSGDFDRYFKVNDFSGFFQDDWKVSRNLTINFGVRYDLYGLPYENEGQLVNFIAQNAALGNPPNGFVQARGGSLAGVPEVEKTLVPIDKNNIAPRIGFAYKASEAGSIVVRGGYGMYFDRISTRYANTQLFNYPYFALGIGLVNNLVAQPSPFFRTDANPFIPLPLPSQFPTAATVPSPLSSIVPLVGVPISGVWVDPKLQTPTIHQFNFGAQGRIFGKYVWELGYVGNRGHHLLQVITINQPVFDRNTNTFTNPLGSSAIFSANKNLTGGNQQVQTTSLARYDSFQASLTRRFSAGSQFLASYTYGESTDYYSGSGVNELTNMPGDQFNWRSNRGPSDFNRRHRFVMSGVYDLPKFVGNDSAARWLVNDWQVAGIAVFQSGLPFSIIDSNGTSIISRANVNPSPTAGGARRTGDVSQRLGSYFNQAAFVTSRFGTATFDPGAPYGNSARNLLEGPNQKNVDISFIKLMPFNERFRGEVRAEMFNVFNWVNYANPGNVINTPTFGRITSASSGPRVVQFAFKLGF